MSGRMQTWLVARRELREGSRSKGLWVGTAMMLVVVVAAIVAPAVLDDEDVTYEVGFAGAVPTGLPEVVIAQALAEDMTVIATHFDERERGEHAVRGEDLDVLVVDGHELVWRGEADDALRSFVSGAIQLATVQQRAAAAGIAPETLAQLGEPVEIDDTELGIGAGRNDDDETAAFVMSILLLVAVATYGQLVLTGVALEKSSRVVEVLLSRMPARTLLAGKVAGIGLLGLAQLLVTVVAAFVATLAVDAVDIPAISGDVLAWVVVWFVLGYAIFAMAYGAFGSLAARAEDAANSAAPVTTLLIVGFWASLIAVSSSPEGGWARLVSFVPVTAPFAMPARIALGATSWWEPVVAAGLAVAGIAGLIRLAGRVYTGAILRTASATRLRDAWHAQIRTADPAGTAIARGNSLRSDLAPPSESTRPVDREVEHGINRITMAFAAIALVIGVAVAAVTSDVVMGVAGGAISYATTRRIASARSRTSG